MGRGSDHRPGTSGTTGADVGRSPAVADTMGLPERLLDEWEAPATGRPGPARPDGSDPSARGLLRALGPLT